MARFHLNLFNDVDVMDEEGSDRADLAAAKAEAIKVGRELMAEHLVLGRPVNLSHRMEVSDAHGKVMAVIPFREMVTIIDT